MRPDSRAVARLFRPGARQLQGALRSPAVWAAATICSVLSGYFFSTLLGYYVRRAAFADEQIRLIGHSDLQLDVPTVLLNEIFKYEGFLLLFVVPVVAMAVTRRRRAPGALGAAIALLAGMLLFTLPLFGFVRPVWLGEPGVVAAGYLGLLLLGSAQLSVGLFVASAFRRAAWAIVATGASLAALDFAGPAAWTMGAPWRELGGLIAFQVRYADFTRGLIAGSGIGYFVTWAVLGWLAASAVPGPHGDTEAPASLPAGTSASGRTSRSGRFIVHRRAVALAAACVGVAAALAWFEPVRIDMTVARRNSLPLSMRPLVARASGVTLIQLGRTRDPRLDWMLGAVAAAGPRIGQEFVDSARHPDVAARYGVAREGTVVVELGSRHRTLETPTMGEVAAAVAEVSRVQDAVPVPDSPRANRRIPTGPRTELAVGIAAMLLPLVPLTGWWLVSRRPSRASKSRPS